MNIVSGSMASQTQTYLAAQRIRDSLTSLQGELATGAAADIGLERPGVAGGLAALRAERASLAAFADSNAVVSSRLSAAQQSLGVIQSSTIDLGSLLIGPAATKTATGAQAASALDAVATQLDQTFAGSALFKDAGAVPVNGVDYVSNLAARFKADFVSHFGFDPASVAAKSLASADIATFVNQELDAMVAPRAGAGDATATRISSGATVSSFVDRQDPSLQGAVAAIVATHELATSAISEAVFSGVATTLSTHVQSAGNQLAGLRARVGLEQTRVQQADDANTSRVQTLDQAIGKIEDIDPYQAITQVNQLMTQIQASYQLTAKLQDLSLAKYL